MSPRTVTGLFILLMILVVAGYDVWTWRKYGVDTTITRVLRGWANRYGALPYILAFVMGCLFGHLFLS